MRERERAEGEKYRERKREEGGEERERGVKGNQNQKCIYSILTKSVYKVTMKRFWIPGTPIKTSLVAKIRAALLHNKQFFFHITS